MKEKYYITTAIAYTSQKPHIGNTYDPVLADAIARYKRMMGFDVLFQTGTDEFGQKNEQNAKAEGMEPQEYVDMIAGQIKDIWDMLDVSYDNFVRTTDKKHQKVVQKIFKKLYEQGDIYKDVYEGKYCIPCESFFTSSQLVDGNCPDCGRPVKDSKEESYFLRMSKYQDQLVEFYENTPDFFMPPSRKNEMINNFIKPGLNDLCVSRTSFKWGVPVDFDPGHVVYVWIDALSNYITGIGYDPDGSTEQYHHYWPADLHVIGKDIVRFHTIYWPVILLALGQPLPKQVLGHPWLLFGDDKMSKSKGNVLYADDLVEHFGADAVRYYLLSEIPFAHDGNITYESFIAKYNTDLANTLGNLVNRTISMANQYFKGDVTKPESITDLDNDLIGTAKATQEKYIKKMDTYHNAEAVHAIMELARRCNKYIDETTPWVLAKQEDQANRLNDVLYNLLEGIRVLAVLLSPILPTTSQSILNQLNVDDGYKSFESIKEFALPDGFSTGKPTPLFARIDVNKKLKELEELAIKQQQQTQEHQGVTFLDEIVFDDFMKLDLRVAKIIQCEPVEKSKNLLKLTLDDGSNKSRTVCSGIAQWYEAKDLIDKSIILVANLKPRKIFGIQSNGMILAADIGDDDEAKVIFVDGIKPGSKVR